MEPFERGVGHLLLSFYNLHIEQNAESAVMSTRQNATIP